MRKNYIALNFFTFAQKYSALKKQILLLISLFTSITLFYNCANMGYPSGGPKDETPPVPLSSNPSPNQLNFKKKKVVIEFNEIVQLENYRDKFVISPPMNEQPVVKAYGKKVEVEILEDLQENATYTLDFANCIVDNNERNPLGNFSFSFATGNTIDSLEMSGILLNASNLEPEKGFTIGIYSNTADSAFKTLVPLRIAKTNEKGEFILRNISPGSYRIFALKEGMKNLKYDNYGEQIAFWDQEFVPVIDTCMFTDTIWTDSVTIDTIHVWEEICYKPDNLVLFAFEEPYYNQYYIKSERKERRRIDLFFSEQNFDDPKIHPLNFDSTNWHLLEASQLRDTLKYWITDSTIYNKDTLRFALEYQKSDTLEGFETAIDTVQLVFREKKSQDSKLKRKRKKSTQVKKAAPVLTFKSNAKSTIDVYSKLRFTFPQPIGEINLDSISLHEKVDTVLKVRKIKLTQDSIYFGRITIEHKWTPGGSYELHVDSAAFTDIYGLPNDPKLFKFKIKELDKYANLTVNLLGEKDPGFLQVLNKSEKVVRQIPFNSNQKSIDVKHLNPSSYYLKIVFDVNNNGEWDPGNYDEQLQSEAVIYFPKAINLNMANWDHEEDWDLWETPLLEQKPTGLHPADDKKNKR